jgi:Leucine-rich repeat (LRR) protein
MIHSSSRTWVSIGLALVLLVGLVQSASLPPAERDFLTEFMLESGQVFYPPRWDILRASYACDENWEGIECVPFGLNSRITLIELERWNYVGTLPASIGDLDFLEALSLVDMGITGSIPSQLGQLDNLVNLNLQGNKFSGQVPSSIWTLGLSNLNLAQNDLSGPLPNFPLNLVGLVEFSLSQNNFSGSIPPSVSNLIALNFLDLSSNQIGGEIPPELFELPSVFSIDISDNLLTGSIPALSNAPELYILDVSNNLLTGEFPDMSGAQNLTSINVGLNQLHGTLPAAITSMPFLSHFIARENAFTGGYPPGFTTMPSLTYWDLTLNQIEGTIPSDIHLLSNLSHFAMSYNLMDGEIPLTLCELQNMTLINLANNRLNGSLPDCLGDLKKLTFFYADSNQISGTIPPSMGYLAELEAFGLSGNQLTGAVPKTLGNATKLEFLLLGSNLLNSEVPFEISYLVNLKSLDLSSNLLYGPFPYGIGGIQKLKYLQIDNNNLSCPLGSLSNLELENCDASNNWLCGVDSSAIYTPTCSQLFPSSCKVTACRLSSNPSTASHFERSDGPDGSSVAISPTIPSFELRTVDPRLEKTSVLKVEVLQLNENMMNVSDDIARRESQMLNSIDTSSLTWKVLEVPITTSSNPNAIQWQYEAEVSQISATVSITFVYLPQGDELYVYNQTLRLNGGSMKMTVSARHWHLLTRPAISKVWATSCLFRVSASGSDSAIIMSAPSGNTFQLKMASTEMSGSIQAITNGQSGDPGAITPKVSLVYNNSNEQAAAQNGAGAFIMAAYYIMPSTSNVTFAYDLAFQLIRTPVPPPKRQILGSTAGFAILMIVLILIVLFSIFAIIMWQKPRLRRKILPCLGRAADPVEYL